MNEERSLSHIPTPSLDYLTSLELPEIPKQFRKILKVSWVGRNGIPAASAVAAVTDKYNQPQAVISYLYKKTIIEERVSYEFLNRELRHFLEMAEEEQQMQSEAVSQC